MDMKRLLTGGIVGAVALFATGYLIYLVILADFFASNATNDFAREAPIFWSIILGEVFMGTLIMAACDWSGSTGWQACAKTGAIVGLLAWGAINLIMYGANDLATMNAHIADIAVTTVRAGIAGALIGMVVAKGGSSAPASEY
ncbi:MAG: hypothetical protein ACE5FP_01075 [Gemmatimonadota bacterium]